MSGDEESRLWVAPWNQGPQGREGRMEEALWVLREPGKRAAKGRRLTQQGTGWSWSVQLKLH